tara:strand:- start:25538 stop:25759 length:222 start_codon:yes stop_codon:yes gene_type:complete
MSDQDIKGLAEQNVEILGVLIAAAQTMLTHTAAAQSGYKASREELEQMLRVAGQLAKIPCLAAENIKRMHEAL